jgi:hypothetical protein
MFRRNPPVNGKHNGNSSPQKEYWWSARASFVHRPDPTKPPLPTFGRPIAFESPEQLWQGCCEYFEWIEEHPIYQTQVIPYKGTGSLVKVPKMRAMTLKGLCIFLNITYVTWRDYRENKGSAYALVCETADNVIYTQKFTGAAADLLNQAIIARDLGLREQHELVGKDGGPIQTQRVPVDLSKLEDEELELLAKMVEKTGVSRE